MSDIGDIEDFGQRWAAAEQAADVDTLAGMVVDDFLLVGPLGFILDRTQWLDRYRNGDLVTSSLNWVDTTARVYADTAVVVGVHDQEAAYHGQANNGRFRSTHVLVRDAGRWQLASMHLSPIMAPPQ
ncbi:nuclear transport factor 2 family protein [Solicola gregarius]|uniref:Nuclear transport factor 2 family protein n=1 Tax=Solicola gregarius TaxID=2908642 RepID=A0AA46TFD2_9ACTN|nr:nuclear transport factor 2 family protein [Solicola gregarius]UYM03844.1 nuclear transport factor 2 family protein [Solicola gregarius]